MARLTGNILSPALRAHFVRPKPLQAVLSLRFTYGDEHPAGGCPTSLDVFQDAVEFVETVVADNYLA